jgi:hypothetical protein
MAAKVVKTANKELSQQEALALLQLLHPHKAKGRKCLSLFNSPGEDPSRNGKL